MAYDRAKLALLWKADMRKAILNTQCAVYSLCLDNKVEEAEKYFNKIRINHLDDSDINKVCITATHGLLHFRKGQPELGREYYIEAMQLAKEFNNSYLGSLAFVNYSREEILRNEEDTTPIVSKLLEIKKNTTNEDVSALVDEVIDLTKTQHRL